MKEYFNPPTNCPECDKKLVVDGKFLVCDNPNCRGVMVGTIMKWIDVSGMGSQGLGEKTIEKLFDMGFIKYPADLYNLSFHYSDIIVLDGFGERSLDKIFEIINSHKEVSLAQFIGGLNLKNFSTNMAELLVENGYDTFEKIIHATIEDLIKIKGIETKTATNFIKGLGEKREIIFGLFDVGVKIKENNMSSSKKLGGMSFCFTGAMSKPRKELEQLVVDNGGEVKGVSRGLTYLVQADPTSTSNKTTKATSLGTGIISEQEFLSMIK